MITMLIKNWKGSSIGLVSDAGTSVFLINFSENFTANIWLMSRQLLACIISVQNLVIIRDFSSIESVF